MANKVQYVCPKGCIIMSVFVEHEHAPRCHYCNFTMVEDNLSSTHDPFIYPKKASLNRGRFY